MIKNMIKPGLTDTEWKTILDVLNVYNPTDIMHVYPEMGEPEFVNCVVSAFHKVHKVVLRLNELDGVTLDRTTSHVYLKQEEIV
jgi:hypothetical protein